MTAAASRPKITDRYERKREALLDAAARVFNDKGLKGATLADVAEAVALSATSVTYYYRKKDDIAAACLLRTIAVFEDLVTQARTEADVGDRIRVLLDRLFELLAEIERGRRPQLITFYDIQALGGDQVETVKTAFNDLFRSLRRLLRPSGSPPADRRRENARAHLFFSVVLWARSWARRHDPDDYPRLAARMADVFIEGLAGARSRWSPPPLPGLASRPAGTPETSREAFLKVATQLLNEEGYQGASVDKISARLNVTKGSFYHHHQTKDDVVGSCFDRTFAIVREAQTAAREMPGTGWDRLTATADALVRLQLSDHGPLLRYTALAAFEPGQRVARLAALDRQSGRFAGALADGVIDGSIRPVDPEIAAEMLMAMINAAAQLTLWVPDTTADEASEDYARPLFVGLLA